MYVWLIAFRFADRHDECGDYDINRMFEAKPTTADFAREIVDMIIDANLTLVQLAADLQAQREEVLTAFGEMTKRNIPDEECACCERGADWQIELDYQEVISNGIPPDTPMRQGP